MCAHADNAALVEIFGGILGDVGDIGGQLFHTALGLAHLEAVFVDVDGCEDILLDHALVEHDGVLVVVAFPGHKCHLEVAAEGELAVFGGVAFGQYVAGLYALAFIADRTQVDSGALVGLTPFGDGVFLDRLLECYEILLFGAVVANTDSGCVDEFDGTVAFGHNLGARVAHELTFDACSDDRSLGAHQRHCLAHHVRSHKGAVGVVVLDEGDERCGD